MDQFVFARWRTPPGCLVLLAWLLCSGCGRNHYELELRPAGDKIQRRLTCWSESGGDEQASKLPAEELGRIDALYPQRLAPPDAARQIFQGEFGERLPADIGGSGRYARIDCPLGRAYVYAERFRGIDDIDTAVVARRLAADRMTDLLLGWFEAEWGGEPGFAGLRKFVHEDLRKDLKNIGLHVWLSQVAANYQPNSGPEFAMRGAHLLLDRGYIRLADLPELSRAARQQDTARLGRFVARFLASKMGVAEDAPLPEKLEFLADVGQIQISLERFLQTTVEFALRQAAWRKQIETDPQATPPQPMAVLEDVLAQGLVDLKLLSHPDVLSVRLACASAPYETNGRWEDKSGQVVWQAQVDQGSPWSPYCFALWSEPDEQQQKKLLGRVALAGQRLAEYALWHAGLAAAERIEWETFANGLRPGADLEKRIESFRFASDAGLADDVNLSATPRQLLLAGLQENP